MKRQDHFRNSELDRAKPKRHIFHSFINERLKRHHSDTGLVEDRTSSVTIVRIIVGLLMIHLIIIGGVLLRGQMVKESSTAAAGATATTPPPGPLTPPPAVNTPPAAPVTPPAHAAVQTPPVAPPAPVVTDALPQPTAPIAQSTPVAAPSNHITQAAQDDIAVDEVDEEPVVIAAVQAPAPAQAPAAPAEPLRHRVAPGDTIYRISNQYGVTEAALKAANPSLAQGVLRAGSTITIPANGQQARVATAAQQAAPVTPAVRPTVVQTTTAATAATAPKVYTVQRGETLSRISRKVKVSVKDLMEINGLKNPNRITPGMELRLSR